ncbi:MAG TPA: FMN-binding protein [Micromonosporaceae bacterium]|jgi:uncharacterized protein with FMN-binding domain
MNASVRRVTLAVAGTAVAVLMLIGYKGTQGAPGATGTTADTESGGEGSAGIAVKQGRATLPPGGYKIDGSVVSTPFGPVQVRLIAGATRIADVRVLQAPNDRGHSTQINNYATPLLRQEVLHAQSADVDVVSGATYTSFAYAQSLQAALDNAARR